MTIHESKEGLAVWLLWGLFELVMKVFEDMSLKVTIHLKVVNLLNDIKYFFNHLVWIHQVSIGLSAQVSFCHFSVVASHLRGGTVQDFEKQGGRFEQRQRQTCG